MAVWLLQKIALLLEIILEEGRTNRSWTEIKGGYFLYDGLLSGSWFLVKNAATLFEVARITALRYSFSARLAIRTDIYIESEF